jgi:hypothetical protein
MVKNVGGKIEQRYRVLSAESTSQKNKTEVSVNKGGRLKMEMN